MQVREILIHGLRKLEFDLPRVCRSKTSDQWVLEITFFLRECGSLKYRQPQLPIKDIYGDCRRLETVRKGGGERKEHFLGYLRRLQKARNDEERRRREEIAFRRQVWNLSIFKSTFLLQTLGLTRTWSKKSNTVRTSKYRGKKLIVLSLLCFSFNEGIRLPAIFLCGYIWC